MLGDAVHHPLEHQPSSVGQVSSPLSAHQILEFCESDLFPETTTATLQDSEVASTSNGCCYEDHSSYTTNISSYPPDVTKSPPATDLIVADNSTTTTTKLAPTTTNDANNNNFSIIFDDDQEITDNNNDIDSVNLDFPTCHHPNLDEPAAAYHFEPQEVEQFDLTLFENQMQILQTTDDHHCNMMNAPILPYTHHPHPNDHVVPVFGQTAFPPNYVCQDDYVSSSMPPSKLMQLNNRQSSSSSSSPNCSFMDPSYLSRNSNPPLPLEDLGNFNANLFLGELQAADNTGGIFCPDTLPRSYNTTNELQAHSYESQHLVHINGSGSCTPLASEITSLEADTYRVTNKLTTEERKEKINRYMKKRNQRNFTKKIKYACRKTLADSRPRVRGRFAKNDEFGDNVNNRTTCCISNLEEDTDHEDVKSYHVVVKEEEEMNYESPSSSSSADIFAHISGHNSFKCNNNYPIQSWI